MHSEHVNGILSMDSFSFDISVVVLHSHLTKWQLHSCILSFPLWENHQQQLHWSQHISFYDESKKCLPSKLDWIFFNIHILSLFAREFRIFFFISPIDALHLKFAFECYCVVIISIQTLSFSSLLFLEKKIHHQTLTKLMNIQINYSKWHLWVWM